MESPILPVSHVLAIDASVPLPNPPAFKLYDSRAVGIATFLGSPLAGAIILFINERRLGRGFRAWILLVAGLILTLAAVGLGFALPSTVSPGIALGLLVAMVQISKGLEGKRLLDHQAGGGKIGSAWVGAGIGAICMVIIFGGIIAIVVANSGLGLGTRLAVGTKDEIYYSGTATKADAQALGDALKADGFLADRGATVSLVKGSGETVLSFVVKDGIWDDPQSIDGFQTVVKQVAGSVGGLPIKLRLMNSSLDVKKEMEIK